MEGVYHPISHDKLQVKLNGNRRMVELLIALLLAVFGTADVSEINSADLDACLEAHDIDRAVVDDIRPNMIPGNGQDLLSPGADPGSNGEPGIGWRE